MTKIPQDKVTDILSGLGAKEIMYHFPANMVHTTIVSYKYLKENYSFAISHLEHRLTEDHLLGMIRDKFDKAVGSKYNGANNSSIPTAAPGS